MSDDMFAAVAERFRGKQYAFTPSLDRGSLYRLSVVVEGETGHYPVVSVASMEEKSMQALADRLNFALRIPEETVARLVAQSMAGDGTKKQDR